jgi:hypothetical protein
MCLFTRGKPNLRFERIPKFSDFSENRLVLFPSARVTPTLPPRLVHVHRLVSSLYPSSCPSAVRLHVGPCVWIGIIDPDFSQNYYLRFERISISRISTLELRVISDCLFRVLENKWYEKRTTTVLLQISTTDDDQITWKHVMFHSWKRLNTTWLVTCDSASNRETLRTPRYRDSLKSEVRLPRD